MEERDRYYLRRDRYYLRRDHTCDAILGVNFGNRITVDSRSMGNAIDTTCDAIILATRSYLRRDHTCDAIILAMRSYLRCDHTCDAIILAMRSRVLILEDRNDSSGTVSKFDSERSRHDLARDDSRRSISTFKWVAASSGKSKRVGRGVDHIIYFGNNIVVSCPARSAQQSSSCPKTNRL
jgi:hypothetical protein